MKAYVHLGSVLALAVSALAMPSSKFTQRYDGRTNSILSHRHPISQCSPIPFKNHTAYYSGHYCCPKIVHEHSVIEPTHDCNVQVSIVTDWGNCTTLDKGFW